MNFSVLMSLYYKERPLFLCASLDSIFTQTVIPDEVILVEDGPLTDELYSVLDEYEKKYPQLKRIKLSQNRGLGKALNEGLKHCSYELVARMDHLYPISQTDGEHTIDPATELVPLCANCHAMIHRLKGVEMTIEKLRSHINPEYIFQKRRKQ